MRVRCDTKHHSSGRLAKKPKPRLLSARCANPFLSPLIIVLPFIALLNSPAESACGLKIHCRNCSTPIFPKQPLSTSKGSRNHGEGLRKGHKAGVPGRFRGVLSPAVCTDGSQKRPAQITHLMALSTCGSNPMSGLLGGCSPSRRKWKSLALSVRNSREEQNKSGSNTFPAQKAQKALGSKLASRGCIRGFTEAAGVSDP